MVFTYLLGSSDRGIPKGLSGINSTIKFIPKYAHIHNHVHIISGMLIALNTKYINHREEKCKFFCHFTITIDKFSCTCSHAVYVAG